MYTSKLLNKEENASELIVTLEYSNGEDIFQEVMTTNGSFRTIEQLKVIVKDKLTRLNEQADISSSLTVGKEIEEPTVTTAKQTEDEIAFDSFMSNYLKLQKVNTLISNGVLTGEETAVVALIASVKSDFKAEYIDLI